MVDTTLAPCVFDAATGDLVLRVCGTSRHGQIVRLKSDKCSIGSGPQCTLRIRARGVRPLHCLLLRGTGGSVVRRWAPDTRLNGRAFTDADLAPGDHLSIAGIDLEVVALGQPEPQQLPTIQLPTTSLQQNLRARREELETAKQQWRQEQSKAQQELQEQSEALNIRFAELDSRCEALEQDRRRWEAERDEAESQSDRQVEQSDAAEAELQVQREELEAAKQQWQQEQSKTQQELQEQSEALNIRFAELDSRCEALEQDRRRWEAERDEAESQSDRQVEQSDAAEAELQVQREELEAAKQQWRQEQSKTQQELQEQSEALSIRSAELETRREALEQDRRRWEAERDEAESQSDRQVEQSDAAEAELQARREELEAAKQQWRQEQSKAQQGLQEQSEALSIRSAELETGRTALEESQQKWELERIEAQERLDEQREQLAVEGTELHRQREEFDRQSEQRQGERAAGESQPVSRPDEPESAEEASPGETSEDSPVDLQSVLRRMGSVDLLHDDDDDPPDRQRCEPQVAAQPEAPIGGASGETSALGSPAAGEEGEEEDESIDDYMSRLMDRVKTVADGPEPPDCRPRVDQPGTPGETAPAGGAPGREPADDRPGVPRLRESDEMSPRAVAPEKQAGLSAMRELANLSAKSAIDRHSRLKLLAVRRAKLAVMTVAAGVGGILIWLRWAKGAGPLAGYAALVAFLVAVFWGIQYAMATGRLIINRSGHIELQGRDKMAEQQEADGKRDEPAGAVDDLSMPADDGQPSPDLPETP